jgi:hypothetical protein
VIFVSGWAEGRGVHSFSPKIFPIKKKKGAEGAAEKKTLKNKQKPSCSLIVFIESKEIATKKKRFQKMQRI